MAERVTSAVCVVACLAVAMAVACSETPQTPTAPSVAQSTLSTAPPDPPPAGQPPALPPPLPPPPALTGRTAVLVAVGDIGECGSAGVAQTARVAEGIDGQIILPGDLAYMQGSMQDYMRCFDPAWGALRRRIKPVPGNHEYMTPGAAGYFQYFGEAAGPAGRSYYSFRAGDWQVLMLDSNVPANTGSPQFEFVRSELVTQRSQCTVAVWHHPLFTSGPNGPNVSMRDMWNLLYQNNADVVVAAHDHLYERFGKQDADGRSDARGVRQFIVGTGGARLYDFMRSTPNSQARIKAHGVLRLTLHSSNYEWAFVEANGAITDSGADGCH